MQEIRSRNLGGRPVGSTIPEKKKKKDDFIRMMNEITEKYCELKNTYLKLPNGKVQKIIDEAKEKYGVSETISYNTIKSRLRRKTIQCNHRGTESPMAAIEPAILEIAIQRGKMNQPLTVAEGLRLANSLIKPGSKLESKVMTYLRKRGQLSEGGSIVSGNLLGKGYWRGFRKQHHHLLVSQRGVQFGHNRSEWCNYQNFKTMYDLVYKAMEQASVAEKLPEAQWQNEKGEHVSKEMSVGQQVQYKITHPDHILYVDEVGNNTCQKDDGNKGDVKYLAQRGTQSRKACSISDAHWTTLGFTAENGEPVLCAIIFAGQSLSVEERLGIDLFAPLPNFDNCLFHKDNYGRGSYFPGGPKCTFRGHRIPCYVTSTPKGSITSEVLRDILKYIDDIGVFPRNEDSPTPFLLLDGHGSRIEMPFLSYINDTTHKWVVCIGVPNGTSLWQVGDSTEQNGCFKMYCSEYKQKLTRKKIEMGLFKLNLTRTDIIPIVNYAWDRSFARIRTNLKAIRDRGWGPLNQVLLSHPDIINGSVNDNDISALVTSYECCQDLPSTTNCIISTDTSAATTPSPQSSPTQKQAIDMEDLNISNGFAGETLTSILRQLQRDKQTQMNLQKNKRNGIDFLESMSHVKKWSSGTIFENNKYHLDEDVLKMASINAMKKENEFWNKVKRYYCEYQKKKKEFNAAKSELQKRTLHNNLPIKILKPLCLWKKRKGDVKMPTKQDGLLVCWRETKDRSDMLIEEYLKTTSTIFETYQKDHKGSALTISVVEADDNKPV